MLAFASVLEDTSFLVSSSVIPLSRVSRCACVEELGEFDESCGEPRAACLAATNLRSAALNECLLISQSEGTYAGSAGERFLVERLESDRGVGSRGGCVCRIISMVLRVSGPMDSAIFSTLNDDAVKSVRKFDGFLVKLGCH
jgi:hypothetical protein